MNLFEKINPTLRDIRKYFDFLFKQGYFIKRYNHTHDHMDYWEVLLEGKKCFIHIYQDRRQINLTLSPLQSLSMNEEKFQLRYEFGIENCIYFISKGEKIIGLFEDKFYQNKKIQYIFLANLLKEHVEQIVAFFSNSEFSSFNQEITLASKEYQHFLYVRYLDSHHKREAFDMENYYIKKSKSIIK